MFTTMRASPSGIPHVLRQFGGIEIDHLRGGSSIPRMHARSLSTKGGRAPAWTIMAVIRHSEPLVPSRPAKDPALAQLVEIFRAARWRIDRGGCGGSADLLVRRAT